MGTISSLDRLVAANFAAKMASGIHEFIFILLLLKVTDGNLLFSGFLFLIRSIPFLLLGPISGLLADTLPRVRLLIISDVVRSTTGLIFIAALWLGYIGPTLIALYGISMATMHVFYSPAYSSEIKSLAKKTSLVKANSSIQIASETGLMLGPFLGAITIGGNNEVNYIVPIACGCVLYIISAMVLGTISQSNMLEKTHDGLSLVVDRIATTYKNFYILRYIKPPDVRTAIIYSSGCIALIAGIISIVVPQLILLNFGSEKQVGIVMGTIAAGTIFGSLICSRFETIPKVTSLMVVWAIYGTVLGLVTITLGSIAIVCAWAFLLGSVGAFIDIYIPTIIQKQSDPNSIGTNFSLFSTSANIGEAVSGLVAGFIVVAVGIDSIALIIGGFVILLALTGRVRSTKRPSVAVVK